MERPNSIILKRCVLCKKEQIWESSCGSVITKDWHDINIKTNGNAESNFGYYINLSYPCRNDNISTVCCPNCIPKAIERYLTIIKTW
jgi:hypothetical protein